MRERDATVLLELLPLPVRLFDSSGMLLRRNTIATAEDANMRGASLRDFWERDQPRHVATGEPIGWSEWPGARAFSGDTQRGVQVIVVRRHLRRLVSMSAAPVRDDNDHITGVVLVEQELPQNGDVTGSDTPTADRDRRLAAVAQLASGVMHDVNNALNPIMAAAFLLDRHAGNPEAVRDYAERIRQAAEDAARTTARVGRFIRQQPLSVLAGNHVDLGSLVNEVIESERSDADSQRLQLQHEAGANVTTHGAATELRDAIRNVVQNAIEAMPDGGAIFVRTFTDADQACVEVRDTGRGMSREVHERAFEPFFSTKGMGHLGLGLAEVYGIARRHRGDVRIDSGHTGTTVTLCVPWQRVEAETPQPDSLRSPLHVLVVEDHDEGREFLERVLASEGHTVEAVRSCAAARERLDEANAGKYDMMITDVGLPDGSGWELVSEARIAHPRLRVGVLSGYEPTAQGADQRGAAFVLHKPLRAAELLAHIGSHVHKH